MTINPIGYCTYVLEYVQAKNNTLEEVPELSVTAMYRDVPTKVCSADPHKESTTSLEMPKSHNLTSPFRVNKMLPGLTSHQLTSPGKKKGGGVYLCE